MRNWSEGSSPDQQRDEIRDAIEDLAERVGLHLWPEELAERHVGDVPFGSASAAALAVQAGLDEADFEDLEPEGEDGFLVGQVRGILSDDEEGAEG